MAHIQQLTCWREDTEKGIPSFGASKSQSHVWSEHAEALTALADGQLQQFVQLLVGVIGREAQLVKTREVPRNHNEITMKESQMAHVLLNNSIL